MPIYTGIDEDDGKVENWVLRVLTCLTSCSEKREDCRDQVEELNLFDKCRMDECLGWRIHLFSFSKVWSLDIAKYYDMIEKQLLHMIIIVVLSKIRINLL